MQEEVCILTNDKRGSNTSKTVVKIKNKDINRWQSARL